MTFWRDKKVVVTGGAGFLGSFIVRALRDRGCADVFVPRSRDYDLRSEPEVVRMFEDSRPDLVIHSAASVGGIGANVANPGKFFYDNALMGLHVVEVARRVAAAQACSSRHGLLLPQDAGVAPGGRPVEWIP